MQEENTLSFLGVVIGLIGFGLLLSVDWRIAVGAFLMVLAVTISEGEEE